MRRCISVGRVPWSRAAVLVAASLVWILRGQIHQCRHGRRSTRVSPKNRSGCESCGGSVQVGRSSGVADEVGPREESYREHALLPLVFRNRFGSDEIIYIVGPNDGSHIAQDNCSWIMLSDIGIVTGRHREAIEQSGPDARGDRSRARMRWSDQSTLRRRRTGDRRRTATLARSVADVVEYIVEHRAPICAIYGLTTH